MKSSVRRPPPLSQLVGGGPEHVQPLESSNDVTFPDEPPAHPPTGEAGGQPAADMSDAQAMG